MIVHSYLRQIAVEFIWRLSDQTRVRKDDIRWVKDNQGVFPQRIIISNKETKKTPYQPDSDLLVLFDVLPRDNVASEVNDAGIYSMWPFDLVINVYGRDADYLIQYIRAKLHDYSVISWLGELKISLAQMPVNSAVLDGFENQTWWIRRKMILDMNITQAVKYENGNAVLDIEDIKHAQEMVGNE